eukprot:67065_1
MGNTMGASSYPFCTANSTEISCFDSTTCRKAIANRNRDINMSQRQSTRVNRDVSTQTVVMGNTMYNTTHMDTQLQPNILLLDSKTIELLLNNDDDSLDCTNSRIRNIVNTSNAKELKKTIKTLYTTGSSDTTPNVSSGSLNDTPCKPNIYRSDHDMDRLRQEMNEQLNDLIHDSMQSYDSEFDEHPPSLFRDKSTNKWTETRIDAQRKSMKRQMFHLAVQSITSKPDNK